MVAAELMNTTEVDFIGKMILDEVMELYATVLPPAETKAIMKSNINSSKDIAQIQGKSSERGEASKKESSNESE